MRLALAVGTGFLLAGALFDVLAGKERLAARLIGFGMLAGLYAGTFALTRWRRAARHATLLAVGYMVALAAGLLHLVSLSPSDADVLAGPISCLMVGSVLMFPWGAINQAIVSTVTGVAYLLAFLPGFAAEGMRAANVVLTIAIGGGISVIGAAILEASRRAAFAERVHVRRLAAMRRKLLDAGRKLRSTMAADEIVSRLLHGTERLIPARDVIVSLFDPDTGSYRVAATTHEAVHAGYADTPWRLDPGWAADFLSRFRGGEVCEYPGGAADDLLRPMVEPLGVQGVLTAVIGPLPQPIGIIGWWRATAEPFTSLEHLAASGIADQACTALTAARLYDEVMRASRLKSQFVSTMSHELRTPLNVIMGYNQILQETLAPEEDTTKALDAIERASAELLELIEATLSLGRLEAGCERVTDEPVAMRELFQELAVEFAAVPRAPGVTLAWDPGEAPTVVTERRKLKTIVKNLVGNALKFTPAGEVRVECRTTDARCTVRVMDTGIGIRPEDRDLVFEMFRQVDSSDCRRYGGTGLGLYIVRQLTALLGGSVALESELGRGSTFTVTLPARTPAVSAAA